MAEGVPQFNVQLMVEDVLQQHEKRLTEEACRDNTIMLMNSCWLFVF